MSVRSFLNRPLFGDDASAESPAQSKSAGKSAGDPQGDPAADAESGPPFDGYDDLDDKEVMEGLSDHSQVELEAAETYERGHEDREPVLDKLRYMRGREPLEGYDALSVKEIVAALEKADLDTIKKVRGYERKFANRPDVLEEVVRVRHQRRDDQPTKRGGETGDYQPANSSAVTIPTGQDSNHVLSG